MWLLSSLIEKNIGSNFEDFLAENGIPKRCKGCGDQSSVRSGLIDPTNSSATLVW
jgi:hypothetical protein